MNWILENITGVLGAVAGILALIATVSKNFRAILSAPFKAKQENFMLDNDRLKAIQEAQEFDNNKIKALQAENEEMYKNAIAQRREITEEMEKLESMAKDLKHKLAQTADLVSLYERYMRYRTSILNNNNIEYKPIEEWKK